MESHASKIDPKEIVQKGYDRIAEKYTDGVFFVSASPSPTYGDNIWANLPNLKAGQSGKITVIVQVTQNTGNTIFNMDQGVTGTGFVNIHNDICTKPPLLTNVVNMNYSEADINNEILVPRDGQKYKSASSDVNLGPPGSCINLREYGSGQYASEDMIKYQNSNRSIEWNKSLKMSHHPIQEGKVVCSDCHNPHGSVGPKLLKEVTVNQTCYNCHAEKRGPMLYEHQPVREDCMTCHTPHGSNNQRLLRERPPYLCLDCHGGTDTSTGHNSNLFGTNFQPGGSNFAAGSGVMQMLNRGCVNCHSQIHGSNSPGGRAFNR